MASLACLRRQPRAACSLARHFSAKTSSEYKTSLRRGQQRRSILQQISVQEHYSLPPIALTPLRNDIKLDTDGMLDARTSLETQGRLSRLSLDTREGYVHLPMTYAHPDTRLQTSDPPDARLHSSRTVLLNDHNIDASEATTATMTYSARVAATKKEIIDYFHSTFTLFERLHETLAAPEAYFKKHESLRHPPIFYVGHTAAFYINKLHLGKFSLERIDTELEMQMAVGVDEMSWDDLDSNSYVWPSFDEAVSDPERARLFVQKVLDFRRNVRVKVAQLMQEQPLIWPVKHDSFWWVIMMGIEHERIHLETSSVILRQASLNFIRKSAYWPSCEEGCFSTHASSLEALKVPNNSLVPIEAGTTRVGRSWESTSTYGWDNEFGQVQHLHVPSFKASEYLVSNKEYLEFVKARGYHTQRWWSSEGWAWVTDMKPEHPRFWVQQGRNMYLRTLTEEVPMPWDWPVEVCHHEAAAFCRYLSEKTRKNIRLPSEGEFLRLRDSEPTDVQDSVHGPKWHDAPGNVNLEHWASSCPVNKFRSPLGVCDVMGNVWQHCATLLDILPGFRTHRLYDDFTTPTVDGLHSRIVGGSWISTGANGATRDSRYGFRRHFYQHAGFRYVESDIDVDTTFLPYERNRALCDAFRFHFDVPTKVELGAQLESFHQQLAHLCVGKLDELGKARKDVRALELGCGPGRTVLELAKHDIGSVHGADHTASAFNLTAQRLLAGGRLRWTNYIEGDLVDHRELDLTELDLDSEAKDLPVHWHQIPDFAAFDRKKFHDFDLVLLAEPRILSKVSDPSLLLSSLHELLRPGGLLIVGTQYEWAAKGRHGASCGEDVVACLLSPWFDAIERPTNLDFAQVETDRKFHCGTQHITFWLRRSTPRELPSLHAIPVNPPVTSSAAPAGEDTHTDSAILCQYLNFHYGKDSEFPLFCAELTVAACQSLGVPLRKALDLGCGPGRSAIELSKFFDQVEGGDYNEQFVDAAKGLLQDGELKWQMLVDKTSGAKVESVVLVEDLGPRKVNFERLDAMALPHHLSGYDLICGFDLIDQLESPVHFLRDIASRVNPGGLLVLTSPYTWSETITPKSKWLGGYKYGDNDGPTSYQGLKELLLSQGFAEAQSPIGVCSRLDEQANGRQFQRTLSQMTFWKRL